MVEEADYTNLRVMVDDTGKVLRDEEEGGYCVWNIVDRMDDLMVIIRDQSVVILPPDDDSTNLIAHLLLRPEEDSAQSALKLELQSESEDETPTTPRKETKDMSTNYWSTETPNVEGSRNCIELLIMVVRTYLIQKMLKDNKTDKKRVWEIVANKMNDCGYRVPGETLAEQGVEVHKKWKYIEMTYLKFQNNEGQKQDRPPYFDMLDKVLGDKQDESMSLSDSDSQDSSIENQSDACEDSVDVSERPNRIVSPSLLFQIMEDLSDYESNCPPQKKPSKDDIINYWSTETPNVEGCKNCTELMITFVGEDLIQELINEKSLSLKKVWQYIAKLMADHGYPVPGRSFEEQGEKVYQKWKNMGRMYAKYKELSSLMQPAYRDPPCYFDVLDKVIQQLQRADNTKLLFNSFSTLNSVSEDSYDIDNQQNIQDSAEDETSEVDGGHGKPRKEDIINYWATKTPDVEGCKDCTELLIMFIGEESIQEMFNDKRSSQKKVWQFLAKIMADHGYRIPGQTVEEQGEKVYQKWKNMGRMYAKYKDHASQAEPAYKDPPSCFAALDKVVQQLQQSDNQTCLLSSFILANTKKSSRLLPEDCYDVDYSHHIKEEPTDVDMSKYEIAPSIHKPTKDEIIHYWLTDTPDVEGCNNCTELLIKIAGGEPIQKLLINKKTSKKKVWQIVAKQLSDLGYEVPGSTIEEQGEKVYQKWKNMGNSYTKFKVNLLQTGKVHKDPPSFFEALDKVLGKNDAFHPRLLLDSFYKNSQIKKKSTFSGVEEIPVFPFKLQLPKQKPDPTVDPQTNQPLTKDEPTSYWYTDTPNIEGCRNCAELLIWIVGEESVQKMLREKVIPKKKVWQKIAKIMNDYGYKVPGTFLRLQGERVHQKWRNMVKVYVKYKEYIIETGDFHKDPPAYFDLMDMVMRMKNVHTPISDIPFPEESAKIENSQLPHPVSRQKRTNPENFWLVETPDVEGCRNRTELLISLVGQKSVQNMLDNKTSTQRKVWQMVAKNMSMYGHKPPGRTPVDQGNRIRDKWRSLEKVYMKYKRHSSHTEQSRKFFPPYFDAMDRMLGKEYVFSPPRKSRNFKRKKEKQVTENDSDMQCSEFGDTAPADTSSIYKPSRKNMQYNSYWLTETPNLEGIRNITELLIMTVGDAMIHKMLHNKRNAKRKVWQYVVHKIEEYGYRIPGNTVAEKGEKLRQKWGNMEKMYLKYKHYEDNTGKARKFFPYYYDAMHKVLGKKQVIRPKIIRSPHSSLTESLEAEQNSDRENTNSSTPKIPLQINKSNATDTDTIEAASTPNYQYSFDELHSYWLTETPNIEGVKNRSELLIRIVGEKSIQTMLNNKKSAKKKVWQLVALKMAKLGHIVPGMTVAEQGVRVRQKWKNMEKVYSKHKEQITELGESWKDPPYYYTTMDEVLGEEDVDHPKLLLGSVHSLKSSQRDSIWGHCDDSLQPSTSDVSMEVKLDALENDSLITNDIEMGEDEEIISEVFQTPKSTMCLKHKENNFKKQEDYYIKELKNMIIEECTKDREAQQQNHDEITKLLKCQNQQRDNMLSILRQLVEKSSGIKKEN